jgi:MYXO-CTERM domain-containing protein
MRLCTLAAGALLVIPAVSAAERRVVTAGSAAAIGDVVLSPASIDDLRFGRQMLPATTNPTIGEGGAVAAVAQSRIIYLNKNGVTLQPGNNDSRTNRSTMATQTVTIGAWNGVSATTWSATVACMRDLFSPFDVSVVETDPGAVPHMEAVFGGSPTQLGMDPNVAGVSPFTTNCDVIENSIVFTFTNVIPQDARLACEIMAQEVAHSYGLDHELLASDPMTYLQYTGNRSFKNQTAACGEDVTRPCGIGGSTCRANQNSVALLTARLGAKTGDAIPPTGAITSPSANALVPPGFTVYASAMDNLMVRSAKLYIDGAVADTIMSGGPFTFTTPSTLAQGLHTLKIEISDGVNVMTTTEIIVTVKAGATPPPAPPGSGPGSGTGGDTGADTGEITGGCSTGGGSTGLLLGLALIGLVRRRRV